MADANRTDLDQTDGAPMNPRMQPPLSAAARRARAEAAARREQASEKQTPGEVGGRGGLDPARFGDWEVKGLASDF